MVLPRGREGEGHRDSVHESRRTVWAASLGRGLLTPAWKSPFCQHLYLPQDRARHTVGAQ